MVFTGRFGIQFIVTETAQYQEAVAGYFLGLGFLTQMLKVLSSIDSKKGEGKALQRALSR